jgi:hypothetical protein
VWHEADLLSADLDGLLKDIGLTHLLHLAWTTERQTYWTSDDNLVWALSQRTGSCQGCLRRQPLVGV